MPDNNQQSDLDQRIKIPAINTAWHKIIRFLFIFPERIIDQAAELVQFSRFSRYG